jgi:hypothetical protein
MLQSIEGLPFGTIGFIASDVVGSDDRHTVLEPTIEWARESGRVRLLYVLAPDFGGYDDGCPFDNIVFGTRHFMDFDRIAFVADDGPFRRMVAEIADLMPTALRVFTLQDIDLAKAWIGEELNDCDHTKQDRAGLSQWLTEHLQAHRH